MNEDVFNRAVEQVSAAAATLIGSLITLSPPKDREIERAKLAPLRRSASAAPERGAPMTPQIAALMADYNRWMNDRLYDAAATLDDAALTADKGAFFGSILATLNHIAVADTIWLHRFAQHPASFAALTSIDAFARPTSLSQSLAPDLAGLRDYRSRLDTLIVQWVAELTPERLAADIRYGNMAGMQSSRNSARCCGTSSITRRIIVGRYDLAVAVRRRCGRDGFAGGDSAQRHPSSRGEDGWRESGVRSGRIDVSTIPTNLNSPRSTMTHPHDSTSQQDRSDCYRLLFPGTARDGARPADASAAEPSHHRDHAIGLVAIEAVLDRIGTAGHCRVHSADAAPVLRIRSDAAVCGDFTDRRKPAVAAAASRGRRVDRTGMRARGFRCATGSG